MLFLITLLSLGGVLKAQTYYEFAYDDAGNRVRRGVVILSNGEGSLSKADSSLNYENNIWKTDVRIFPNPTKGTVCLETADSQYIADYWLYDNNGVLLDSGQCGSASLTLDLSSRNKGIYLLEALVGKDYKHFKIIKQ